MSKSRRIFKKLFWWLSKSKSEGNYSPKERTSSQETITTGEKEEEKSVIKTDPPVEQPQPKEEEKPVININPPIEEPWEPLKQEEKKEDEEEKIEIKPIILKDLPKLKEEEKPKKKVILPSTINTPKQEEIEAHNFLGRDPDTPPPGIKILASLFGESNEDLKGRKIYLETFNSISSMLYVLDHRKNNFVMRGRYESEENDFDFTGTYSYEEAKKLYINGYTKILGEVKKNVKKLVIHYILDNSSRSNVVNEEIGFIPNVPNALMNLPASMIHRKPCQRKIRTIKIMYFMEGNCWMDKNMFKKAGIILLAAIEIIEKQRINIKLEVGCCAGFGETEIIGCVIKLKNYHERTNIQKLCFPLAHPSFFRRFGFKFIETFPALSDRSFRYGYGHSMELDQIKRCYTFEPNTVILNTLFINRKLNNNVNKLIEYINKQCQIL